MRKTSIHTSAHTSSTLCCFHTTQAPELTPATGKGGVDVAASIKSDVFAFGVLLLELLQGQLLVTAECDDGGSGECGDMQQALVKYSRRVHQVNACLSAMRYRILFLKTRIQTDG